MQLADMLYNLTLEGFTLGVVGCDSIEVRGSVHLLNPELKQALREHKPTLLAMLRPRATHDDYALQEREAIQNELELPYEPFDVEAFYEARASHWDAIPAADRQRITTAVKRVPCPWCSGRNHHDSECFGLPRMFWGKYQGRPLSQIPERYLAYVVKKGYGKTEHRRAIVIELQRRFIRYCTEGWEGLIDNPQAEAYNKRIAPGLRPEAILTTTPFE